MAEKLKKLIAERLGTIPDLLAYADMFLAEWIRNEPRVTTEKTETGSVTSDGVTPARRLYRIAHLAGMDLRRPGMSEFPPVVDDPYQGMSEIRRWCLENAPASSKTQTRKEAAVAAIATHLLAKPAATSKEIGKAIGLDPGTVRTYWGPIKKAQRNGKYCLPKGHKNKGQIGGVAPNTECSICGDPLSRSFWCQHCNESIQGECKMCHLTNRHPDEARP